MRRAYTLRVVCAAEGDMVELTITTDRNRQWSRTLYVVDEETFARISQILKENDMPAAQRSLTTRGAIGAGAYSCEEEGCKNPAVLHYCEEHDR